MFSNKFIVTLATFTVLGLGVIRGEKNILAYFELKESEELLLKTVEKLEKENRNLQEEIDKIENSPIYARKVLREKYHVTEPGESIIFFAD